MRASNKREGAISRQPILLLMADISLIALATILAFVLRDGFDVAWERMHAFSTYLLLTCLIGAIVFGISGINRSVYRFTNLSDYLWLSLMSFIVILGSVAIGFLFNRLDFIARALPVLQLIAMVGLLILARVGYRLYHARRISDPTMAPSGSAVEHVVVLGVNPVADLFLRSVDDLAYGRIRVVGLLCPEEQNLRGRTMGTRSVLGSVTEAEDALGQLRVHGVDVQRIVVTVAQDSLTSAEREALARVQDVLGVNVDFFADSLGFVRTMPHVATVTAASEPVTQPSRRPMTSYRVIKRALDLALATILLILTTPLIVAVAVIVFVDVGRPLLFWQQRPGQGGRPIRVFKFRTMGSAYDAAGRRRADVERVSRVGSMLRAKRLDELPQLFNILNGEMAFVAPRPLLPIDQPDDQQGRLRVKPGLTGWAQVMGGRGISPNDKAALDLWYVENMSLWLDLEIMVRTIPMVLFGEKVHPVAIRQACDALGRLPDLEAARAITYQPLVVPSLPQQETITPK